MVWFFQNLKFVQESLNYCVNFFFNTVQAHTHIHSPDERTPAHPTPMNTSERLSRHTLPLRAPLRDLAGTPYPYEHLRVTEPAHYLEIDEVATHAFIVDGTSPPTEHTLPEGLK